MHRDTVPMSSAPTFIDTYCPSLPLLLLAIHSAMPHSHAPLSLSLSLFVFLFLLLLLAMGSPSGPPGKRPRAADLGPVSVTGRDSEDRYGGFPKLKIFFGGPLKKDYSILGSILGTSYFEKLPYLLFLSHVYVNS